MLFYPVISDFIFLCLQVKGLRLRKGGYQVLIIAQDQQDASLRSLIVGGLTFILCFYICILISLRKAPIHTPHSMLHEPCPLYNFKLQLTICTYYLSQ